MFWTIVLIVVAIIFGFYIAQFLFALVGVILVGIVYLFKWIIDKIEQ